MCSLIHLLCSVFSVYFVFPMFFFPMLCISYAVYFLCSIFPMLLISHALYFLYSVIHVCSSSMLTVLSTVHSNDVNVASLRRDITSYTVNGVLLMYTVNYT